MYSPRFIVQMVTPCAGKAILELDAFASVLRTTKHWPGSAYYDNELKDVLYLILFSSNFLHSLVRIQKKHTKAQTPQKLI